MKPWTRVCIVQVLDKQGLQGMAEFLNEVRLARSIQHPHVVRLLGFTGDAAKGASRGSEGNGTQCLVYELLTNGNLEDRLLRRVRARVWSQRGCLRNEVRWLQFRCKGVASRCCCPCPAVRILTGTDPWLLDLMMQMASTPPLLWPTRVKVAAQVSWVQRAG